MSFIGVHWGALFYVTGTLFLCRAADCRSRRLYGPLFIFANTISLLPYCTVVTSFRGLRVHAVIVHTCARHNFRQGTSINLHYANDLISFQQR